MRTLLPHVPGVFLIWSNQGELLRISAAKDIHRSVLLLRHELPNRGTLKYKLVADPTARHNLACSLRTRLFPSNDQIVIIPTRSERAAARARNLEAFYIPSPADALVAALVKSLERKKVLTPAEESAKLRELAEGLEV